MMPDALEHWIGRTEERTDRATAGIFAELAATLDHVAPPWQEGEMPPLGHWVCFHPLVRQSEIGADGHPAKGAFLPPIALPRRMWAGSRVSFLAPVRIGDRLRRRMTIADLKQKNGRSGRLAFVTIRHDIANDSGPVITEMQDLVYREAANAEPSGAVGPVIEPNPTWHRLVTPDPVLLFRFSALTFNAHRIHYDRPYAENVEHYPGLVVQGPLTAMLLMDFFLRAHPAARVTEFSFRGQRPLTDIQPFTLSGLDGEHGAELSAIDAQGYVAMTAELHCLRNA